MAKNIPNRTRPTGIDVISIVPWGTHLCQFYETADDLRGTLVPYFKSGLENNEICIWVTSEPMTVEEATEALNQAVGDLSYYETRGQIQIVDHHEFYCQGGKFDGIKVIQQILEREEVALSSGFDGVRVNGNISWLPKEEWSSFVDYESGLDTAIRSHRIIAVCSYPLECHRPDEIVDIVSNHQGILIRRTDKLEYVPNNGHRYAVALRNRGLSYAEISRRISSSRQWVAQILRGEKNRERRKRTHHNDEMLTLKKAAEFLDVHVNTVRRWSDSGILPAYRIGQRRDRRFRRTDLEKFLNDATADCG